MKHILIIFLLIVLTTGCVQQNTSFNNSFVSDTTNIDKNSNNFRIAYINYSVTKEKYYDGNEYYLLYVNVEFENYKKIPNGQYAFMNVSMDTETIDKNNNKPNFLNELNIIRASGDFVYGLNNGFLSNSIYRPLSEGPNSFTTIITLHDNIGKTSVTENITYEFKKD